MGIERECKFKATAQLQKAVLEHFSGPSQTIRMATTYYDTPDRRLGALRYTLRSRMENDVCICTLKTPEKDGARGEWDVEETSIDLAVPVLCKLSGLETLAFLLQCQLIPTCGARFTRIAKEISLADCTVELALDAGVLTGGGKEEPLCEIEAELKSGSRESFECFIRELRALFQLEEEPLSKFRRANLLCQGE